MSARARMVPASDDGYAPVVAVVGAGDAVEGSGPWTIGEAVGAAVARARAVLVCGGLGGVMAAACRGARAAGGRTVGFLPGEDRRAANPWVELAVPTGLGEARNLLVVRSADAVVAVGGGYGTLSEIALARKLGRPVVGLSTWSARAPAAAEPLVVEAADPAAAVALALELAARSLGGT
jgi:uncharacterized protein (TIGR00725 family)